MLFKKIKPYCHTESGRSMVEMLGVLAIIGVLSIAGIAGYKVALDMHKGNEVLNTFNMMAVSFATQIETDPKIGELSNEYSLSNFGITVDAYPSDMDGLMLAEDENAEFFTIDMEGMTPEVCRHFLRNVTFDSIILVAGEEFDGDNLDICDRLEPVSFSLKDIFVKNAYANERDPGIRIIMHKDLFLENLVGDEDFYDTPGYDDEPLMTTDIGGNDDVTTLTAPEATKTQNTLGSTWETEASATRNTNSQVTQTPTGTHITETPTGSHITETPTGTYVTGTPTGTHVTATGSHITETPTGTHITATGTQATAISTTGTYVTAISTTGTYVTAISTSGTQATEISTSGTQATEISTSGVRATQPDTVVSTTARQTETDTPPLHEVTTTTKTTVTMPEPETTVLKESTNTPPFDDEDGSSDIVFETTAYQTN